MRRISAILSVVLIGFSLIGPAFSSDIEASLPACCRRAGQHHCTSMGSGSSQSSGPVFQAGGHCPMFPGTLVLLSGFPVVLPIGFGIIAALLALQILQLARRNGHRTAPAALSHLKRGPPALVFVA